VRYHAIPSVETQVLHHAVRRAFDTGAGFYERSWSTSGVSQQRLVHGLLAWCRETAATVPRPSGVESMSLALAARDREKRVLASARLSLLRVRDFSDRASGHSALRGTVASWSEQGLLQRPGTGLWAVLFSWGELVEELILGD
jgi:hypothetical protein